MSIKEKIKESVELSLTKAREIYKMDFPTPPISFNLRGSCAGQAGAKAYVNGKYADFYMKFNIQIAEAHMGEFMVNTVPHEVAHIVSFCLYGTNGRGHGREWKTIVRSFGLEPNRCHNYDMSKVSYYMERRNLYTCSCGHMHRLTKRMEKNIESLHCKLCKSRLTPKI